MYLCLGPCAFKQQSNQHNLRFHKAIRSRSHSTSQKYELCRGGSKQKVSLFFFGCSLNCFVLVFIFLPCAREFLSSAVTGTLRKTNPLRRNLKFNATAYSCIPRFSIRRNRTEKVSRDVSTSKREKAIKGGSERSSK